MRNSRRAGQVKNGCEMNAANTVPILRQAIPIRVTPRLILQSFKAKFICAELVNQRARLPRRER
jgi:hypothetical protein